MKLLTYFTLLKELKMISGPSVSVLGTIHTFIPMENEIAMESIHDISSKHHCEYTHIYIPGK